MIYLSTQKGTDKIESEDAVLVGREVFCETTISLPMPESGFICVADGVGGVKGGRAASHHILSFLSENYVKADNLREFVLAANESLLRIAADTPGLTSMATTLSGIWYSNGCCYLLHIGNTRVYARQGKYLKQLTSDHTLYKMLMSMGRTEEAESCNRNVIVGCLGGNRPDLISYLNVSEINATGTLLLTSDGVHEYVTIDFLEGVLSSNQDNIEKCTAIIEAARAAGSKDDLTVVLVGEQEV